MPMPMPATHAASDAHASLSSRTPARRRERRRRRLAPLALAALLAAASVACSGGSDGEATVLTDLSLTPTEVPAGRVTEVTASLVLSDAEADATELTLTLTPPGGAPPEVQRLALTTVGAVSAVTVSLLVSPPAAGDYAVAIEAVDAGDHVSNRLSGTFHAR